MAGFKTQSKRKRELAKLDKRRAKDEKRALRKAERSGSVVAAVPAAGLAVAPKSPPPSHHAAAAGSAPVRKPLTFEEAVQRWKTTKVVKAKPRW